jgi:hypothetical protein
MMSLKLVGATLVVAGLIACNPIPAGLPMSDTDVVSPPAATATAGVMLQAKGSFVDPKLIGPEYRLQAVNQTTDCAPESGGPLPENCHGRWWLSFGVIAETRAGTHVSQSITQFPRQIAGASQLAHQVEVINDVTRTSTYSQRPTDTPVPGSLILVESTGDKVYVLSPKAEFLASVLVWGKKESTQQATELATRVMTMLLDRVPDKLGGPIPNPDYWGNKYWQIK